jgi:hypothetical protein
VCSISKGSDYCQFGTRVDSVHVLDLGYFLGRVTLVDANTYPPKGSLGEGV